MRRPLLLSVVLLCLFSVLAGSAALAGTRDRDLPTRYLPGSLDGQLDMVTNQLDGREWAAWAYRNGAEFDIAVAVRDEDGIWSEPYLIGVDDGIDQAEPVLAIDSRGSLYLAYAERSPAQVLLTWLPVGGRTWHEPVELTTSGVRTGSPELKIVVDRLVVAFRAGRGLVILDLPLVDPVNGTNIFNDGPDPVDARGDGAEPTSEGDHPPAYPFSDRDDGGNGSDPWDPPGSSN